MYQKLICSVVVTNDFREQRVTKIRFDWYFAEAPLFLHKMNFLDDEVKTSDDIVRGTNDDATVSRL